MVIKHYVLNMMRCCIPIQIKVHIMARKSANSASNSNANFKPADAFLRLEVLDSQGNRHRLPKDMALHLEKHVHENMIKAQLASGETEVEFKLVGVVHVVDNSPKEDIKF